MRAAAAAGRMVVDRYRLIAQLGAGGMGVTYRAWDTLAGVPVVVKMPQREIWRDREMMARFSREIEAMRAVLHDSIVPITDSGADEGCPFVVMRFLPGGSLAEYRRRDDAGNPIRNPPGMLHFWLPGVAAARPPRRPSPPRGTKRPAAARHRSDRRSQRGGRHRRLGCSRDSRWVCSSAWPSRGNQLSLDGLETLSAAKAAH